MVQRSLETPANWETCWQHVEQRSLEKPENWEVVWRMVEHRSMFKNKEAKARRFRDFYKNIILRFGHGDGHGDWATAMQVYYEQHVRPK